MPDDWTDHHVARWRDHWAGISYDDEVEGIVVRINRISRYLDRTVKIAAAASNLQESEYKTLHALMIRDTPGSATPGELADDLKISAAGMTGRLDSMEQKGWITRRPAIEDRRRVYVQITTAGIEVWRGAMANRGTAEDELIGVLPARDRAALNRTLKRLTLYIESLDK